ncbi:hypothetical protein [Salipiger mucosus]|uniref:Permease n=1 Tax=Salipiger mucosus DSM 16094 TaxID=1123237 RepID=S9R082_9RHOB|nr:hypothetical protein [Salipiger mucosus]EPX85267.1 hypothetical protein Salmuc_02646 [Salipiger mucosus DSM 16094]
MKNTEAEAPPARRPRKILDGGFLVLLGFTLAGGIAVFLTRGGGRVADIAAETLGFVAVLSPKIAAGIFIAATLPMCLPREKVGRLVGRESGWRGLAVATACGAALPGGPMMTFPLAAGLGTAGADMGAVVAFISGWSLLGLNRTLIWEFSFLPADLVWTRYLLSLPAPLLLGLTARAMMKRRMA